MYNLFYQTSQSTVQSEFFRQAFHPSFQCFICQSHKLSVKSVQSFNSQWVNQAFNLKFLCFSISIQAFQFSCQEFLHQLCSISTFQLQVNLVSSIKLACQSIQVFNGNLSILSFSISIPSQFSFKCSVLQWL